MLQAIASNDHLSIAIVGAGATGVELASELVRLADVLEQHGASGARSGLKIYLIESQPRILGPFPERVAHAAHTVPESLGIEVLPQRSEARTVGKECVRKWRSRVSPYH